MKPNPGNEHRPYHSGSQSVPWRHWRRFVPRVLVVVAVVVGVHGQGVKWLKLWFIFDTLGPTPTLLTPSAVEGFGMVSVNKTNVLGGHKIRLWVL